MRMYGFTQYGGPEVAETIEAPVPSPGRGQVRIRMEAAGVNPADIKVRSGQRVGQVEVRFPMAMGREACGIVEELGEGVQGLESGQRVVGAVASGTGALAEQVLLVAGSAAPVPAAVSPAAAACVPVALGTAHDALDELDLPEGSTLLVLGAGGGVGSAACALARARGLRVVGVASASKALLLAWLGAEHVESGPGWEDRVRSVAPEGVDGALDLVGEEVLEGIFGLVADPACVRSTAAPASAKKRGGAGVKRRRKAAVFAEVLELMAAGAVEPAILGRFALEDAAEAVAAVEGGHAAGNTVVLAPAPDSAPAPTEG